MLLQIAGLDRRFSKCPAAGITASTTVGPGKDPFDLVYARILYDLEFLGHEPEEDCEQQAYDCQYCDCPDNCL